MRIVCYRNCSIRGGTIPEGHTTLGITHRSLSSLRPPRVVVQANRAFRFSFLALFSSHHGATPSRPPELFLSFSPTTTHMNASSAFQKKKKEGHQITLLINTMSLIDVLRG